MATTILEVPQVLAEIRTHGGRKLSAVGKLFPAARGNGTVNPATVWRWARIGATTPSGERVRLEVVKVGMSWLTSDAAVNRFVAALTGDMTPPVPPKPTTTPAQRRARSEAAGRKLAAIGA